MKKLLLIVVAALSAIIVEAQQLRDGHFFKSFTDAQVTAQAAPEVFNQWFTLPEGTEWREVRRETDHLGMEHVDYRQYVGGFEVEHAIVKLHFKDGMLRSANGNVMEARRSPAKLRRAPLVFKDGTPVDELGRKLLLIYTNEGYRYAMKMLSADGNYWIYIDAESGKELQRISTRYFAGNGDGQHDLQRRGTDGCVLRLGLWCLLSLRPGSQHSYHDGCVFAFF